MVWMQEYRLTGKETENFVKNGMSNLHSKKPRQRKETGVKKIKCYVVKQYTVRKYRAFLPTEIAGHASVDL